MKEDTNEKVKGEFKEVIEKEIKEEIEEVMEEAIGKAIEQAIEEEIKAEIEVAISDDPESETVSNNFSPDEIVEEINIIEDMINENKMIQIVTDIVNTDDIENAKVRDEPLFITEEKKHIKNIDGFHIGLKKQADTTPVMEIPLTSQILIINDTFESASDDIIDIPKVLVKKTPISSIDFGLIQEV